MFTRSKASTATATVGGSAMNPMEDDTSSTALRPAVPSTEGSLAEAAGAPVSSNIPPLPPNVTYKSNSGEHDPTQFHPFRSLPLDSPSRASHFVGMIHYNIVNGRRA
ncbi:hypothetical protein MTO96_045531 [Rhipicephalus appendiculatus]